MEVTWCAFVEGSLNAFGDVLWNRAIQRRVAGQSNLCLTQGRVEYPEPCSQGSRFYEKLLPPLRNVHRLGERSLNQMSSGVERRYTPRFKLTVALVFCPVNTPLERAHSAISTNIARVDFFSTRLLRCLDGLVVTHNQFIVGSLIF